MIDWMKRKFLKMIAERKQRKSFEKLLKQLNQKSIDEALDLLVTYIKQPSISSAYKGEALLKVASIYESEKQLELAAQFYDEAFEVTQHVKYDYAKELDKIFELFYKTDRKDFYDKWHAHFTKRRETQKSFKKFNVPTYEEHE